MACDRAPQQPQVKVPCGACGGPVLDRHRFACAGWIAHTESVVENVQRASDRGGDRFGVAIGGGDGPPRRRAFRLTEFVPRVRISKIRRCYGVGRTPTGTAIKVVAVGDFGGRGAPKIQREPTGRREGEGGGSNSEHALRTGSGKLGTGGRGTIICGVPVPCPLGGVVRVSCMLERAGRPARGPTGPKSCAACSCESVSYTHLTLPTKA